MKRPFVGINEFRRFSDCVKKRVLVKRVVLLKMTREFSLRTAFGDHRMEIFRCMYGEASGQLFVRTSYGALLFLLSFLSEVQASVRS